jgi:hypothetical protein
MRESNGYSLITAVHRGGKNVRKVTWFLFITEDGKMRENLHDKYV